MLTRWYVVSVILMLLVPLCVTAGNPDEDRPKLLEKLLDAVDTDDKAAHGKAVERLQEFIDERDIERVLEATKDRRIRVREDALRILACYRGHSPAEPPDICGVLLANFRSKNPRLRLAAAHVARNFAGDSSELLDALVEALDDHAVARPALLEAGTVSEYAAESLGEVGAKARRAYPALLRVAAKGKGRKLRECACYAIGRLALEDEGERPKLITFLVRQLERGETASDRIFAAIGLRASGPAAAAALPALRKAYRCEGVQDAKDRLGTRKMIVEVYMKIGRGAKAALPDLLPALRDRKAEKELRLHIAEFAWSLQKDGKEAWPIIQRIVADETEDRAFVGRLRYLFDDLTAQK